MQSPKQYDSEEGYKRVVMRQPCTLSRAVNGVCLVGGIAMIVYSGWLEDPSIALLLGTVVIVFSICAWVLTKSWAYAYGLPRWRNVLAYILMGLALPSIVYLFIVCLLAERYLKWYLIW